MDKILTALLLGAFAVGAHAASNQGGNDKSAALLAGRSGKTVHLYDYETPDGTYSASLYPSSVKNLGNGWYSTVTLHQPARAGKHAHMLIFGLGALPRAQAVCHECDCTVRKKRQA
ncbi:MAG: hypothetical protein ACFNKE_04905 [Neisseria elongata]